MPLNGVNYVTIASDASASQGKLYYGIAYYVRDDAGTHKYASRVDIEKKHLIPNSRDAELYALYAALQFVAKASYPAGTKVIYYADNATVIQVIDDSFTEKTRRKYEGLIELAKEVFAGMEVETRHVKSHTRNHHKKDAPKRFYMNDWCDKNARAMMRHGRMHAERNWRKEKPSGK